MFAKKTHFGRGVPRYDVPVRF